MVKKLPKQWAEPDQLSFARIFVLQIVLFFAICGIMLVPRFSTDSYSVYFYTGNGLNGFLELGRVGTFLLYKALLALGINSVTMSPVFTAVFCLTVAWSAAVFLSRLKTYLPSLDWPALLFVELAAVLAFANIYFAELFFFSDVALVYAMSTLFMTLAMMLFFHQNRVMGLCLSLLCLCCSLSFYQASLGMFMILCSALILVKHDVLWPSAEAHGTGPLVRELLWLLAVGGGASLINVLTMKVLGLAGFYSDRSPSLGLADIVSSIQQMLRQFGSYYSWGYPSYLTGILKVVFILAGPVLLFLLADSFDKNSEERYPLSSLTITLAVLIADFLLVFAPHFLSKSVWMPPRSICSFFALFSFMAVITGFNYLRKKKRVPLTALTAMLLLVAVNVAVIQCIALDQIKVNQMDRQEAEEIVRRIEEYEQESGQTVDTIRWRSDGAYTWTHPGIKYTFMDMNVRAGGRRWSLIDCISYYAGRRFQSAPMPEDIWGINFREGSWDSFVPEEQILFEGSTMYLMAY